MPGSPIKQHHIRNFSQTTGLTTDPIEVIHDESAVGSMFYLSKSASLKPQPPSSPPLHYYKGPAHQPLLNEKGWGEHQQTIKSPLQAASDRRWQELTRQFTSWPSGAEDWALAIGTCFSWLLTVACIVLAVLVTPWFALGVLAALLLWLGCWLLRRRKWQALEGNSDGEA